MRIRSKRLFATAAVLCGCAVLAGSAAIARPTAGTSLPNPFKVVRRWSAKKLGLKHPTFSLAIGPSGNLYLTDYKQRVTEVSPKGKVLRRWGKRGSGRGEFDFVPGDPTDPSAVTGPVAVAPDGKVYVSDSGNARVEVFSARGRFLRQFGSFGRGANQFLSPGDLAVDGNGNSYVIDGSALTLRKFSAATKVLWSIGSPNGDPDLAGHFHLNMLDRHGRLVVANDDKSRVMYIDQGGHKVDAFGSKREMPASACDVTVDRHGLTYVDGCGPPNVTEVFGAAHKLVGRWPRSPLCIAPRFGPHGEIFALTWKGTLLKLRIKHLGG